MTGQTTDILQDLGTQIRNARLAAGMTQRELGERIGRSRPSVSNIESGRQGHISVSLLIEISRALDATFQIG